MAFKFDTYDQALVIDGWQEGVAENPFNGISDLRNVNVVSIKGEASVGFSTTLFTNQPVATAVPISSADSATDRLTITSTPALVGGTAIYISGTNLPGGVVATLPYWIGVISSTVIQLYSDPGTNNLVDITSNGTPGDWTLSTVNINKPKYSTTDPTGNCYIVDALGQAWFTTPGKSFGFSFMGNRVPDTGHTSGNGIQYYQASDGTGYLFVFHNSSIDYTPTASVTSTTWQYQWNFTAGTVGVYSATPTARLNTGSGANNSHESTWAQDNVIYYCDAAFLGSFFEKSGQVFSPTTIATYTPALKALALPAFETAQCLTELGIKLLVGGQYNKIYPWDRTSTSFTYPIWISENFIAKMITINTNTYIFAGNRGRIYLTNGSQAQLLKKIPDHISGTTEPDYTWGGVSNTKNQIYFGVLVRKNGTTTNIAQYGGIWALDVDTNVLRLTNQLSYGTYNGYPTVIQSIVPTGNTSNAGPSGTGLYIGWDSGASTYGIDKTSSNPYTGSQASIDTDLIPIGTYNKPRDFTKVEYLLTRPLVSGESITIKTRTIFNTQDVGYTTTLTDSTIGNYTNTGDINFKNAQWVQFQIVLNSTTTSPSFVRLKHIRILGLTGPTLATSQTLSL